MKALLFLCCLFFVVSAAAQTAITIRVTDAQNHEPIRDASAIVSSTQQGTRTDTSGTALLDIVPPTSITISAAGYATQTIPIDSGRLQLDIALQKVAQTLEEVIVSSSRTDSRIENLPTRVEVLGTEEVEEESGIKPANVASLLGDVAGIQSQQTSAVTGNTEMRVQGLPGNYTQLLRDGMPLFGDFAGSFSILQIPPLDLKQIEIIKGATSTLYGGGAIAGIINLISKKPKLHTFEKTVLLNYSTLNEANAHVYLSNRNAHFGYTFFTGLTRQQAADVNGDGFSDVARLHGVFIHPQLFFYPDKNNTISVGYNGAFDNRKGGDMTVLKSGKDAVHQFFIQNKLVRHTADVQWQWNGSSSNRFTLKAIGSWFDRNITTATFDTC
jgi:outer membrane receptor for ferrienterochelin and colicins